MESLANFSLLPDLKFVTKYRLGNWGIGFVCEKRSSFEVCPKCATKSFSIYDRRAVKIKDEPIRGKGVFLKIIKRRFICKPCKKPFTEPVSGISKGYRSTARFRRSLNWAAEKFSNLKDVCKAYRSSPATVYKAVYSELDLRRRKHSYPLPKHLGIDEHSLRKPKYKETVYASIFVDHIHKRVYDLCEGRSLEDLNTLELKGKENVEAVSIDMSPVYKSFVKSNFPTARIVSDPFHVIRLFNKLLNYHRKKLTGDDRKNPIRKLLLRNRENLKDYERRAMDKWLDVNLDIKDIYNFKEAMRRVYRMKGLRKAKIAFLKLIGRMEKSGLKRVSTLCRTIKIWREEILNYHRVKITNGRTEGFNRKAKLLQRAAYGYKSFKNYRLKLLNACWVFSLDSG